MAMKPVIASSRGPSGEAASRTAWTTNQVATAAANATPAPSAIGRRFEAWMPVRLAETAAKISTASRPSLKTIIPELKTTVVWLMCWPASVGSAGPVSAVAIR